MITSHKPRHCKLFFLFALVAVVFVAGMASASISFNPILPPNSCNNERIDVTIKGTGTVKDFVYNACRSGSINGLDIYVGMWEDDLISDDVVSSASFFVQLNSDCRTFYYEDRFSIVPSSFTLESGEGSNVEFYASLYDGGSAQYTVESTSDSIISVLTNCQCLSGTCCVNSSRPYTFALVNSQPTGINDAYTCSGTISPTTTSYVVKNDYFCSGTSAGTSGPSLSNVATCGICKYCSPGSATCGNYDSSNACGTTDCDYKDIVCRDYNDVNSMCNGAGGCVAGSCTTYTDKPFDTPCGSNSECDGSGTCVSCTPQAKTVCNDDDVYWADACYNLGSKKVECGVGSCDNPSNICKGSDLYQTQTCYRRGCGSDSSSASCYTEPYYPKDVKIQTCQFGCSGGACKPDPNIQCTKNSDCGTDQWLGSQQCFLGNIHQVWRQYVCDTGQCRTNDVDQIKIDCGGKGCSTTTNTCNSAPSCTDDCTAKENRCNGGYAETCGNYDSDSCSEWPTALGGSGSNYCTNGCSWGTCNAPPALSCDISYTPWNSRWTGFNDKTASINGNPDGRFLCYNKIIRSCGWDVNPSPIPTQVESNKPQGTIIGSWQCDANNKKWVLSGTPPPSCTNDCISGALRCSGSTKQICGNYDADSCSEWPASTSGSGNELCQYGCENNLCKAAPPVCTPNWRCSAWSACTNGQRARICSDSNSCGVTTGKPSESEACTAGTCYKTNVVTVGRFGYDWNKDGKWLAIDVNGDGNLDAFGATSSGGSSTGGCSYYGTIIHSFAGQAESGYTGEVNVIKKSDSEIWICRAKSTSGSVYRKYSSSDPDAASADKTYCGYSSAGEIPVNLDCSVTKWGKKFTGAHNKVGLSNGDPRFLCYDKDFYECGWELSIPEFATKISDKVQVSDWICDLGNKKWNAS